jgi:Na+-transporting NADH:ubiquinone oxidoreductase subunit E
MGIGFQSFGGMLTGGDDAVEVADEKISQTVAPEVVIPEEEIAEENEEVKDKVISYNDIKK